MKNLTKFITLLSILILCSFVWIPSTHAVVKVPDREGTVTDTAQLFSAQELRQLEQSLNGQDYRLVVLTASSLSEREGEQLANDAYDQWKLETNELILVITVNPNFVHLVFDSAVLAEQVATSDARNAKGVIDRTFVPLASDGRLVDGVIAVSEYVNSLPPLGSNGSAPPMQPEQPRPAIPNEEPQQRSGGPAWIWLLLIAAGIGILLLLKQFSYVRNLRRRLHELEQQHRELTPTISKMMVSSLFKELENGFVQGETARQLRELEQTVLKQHKQAQQYADQLAQIKVPLFASTGVKQDIEELAKQIGQLVRSAKKQGEELAKLEQLSREVRREVEEAKMTSQQLSQTIDQLARDYNYPLDALKQQYAQANRILTEADQLDEFDFVQAGQMVTQLREYFTLLGKAVSEFHQYIVRYREYPQRIDALDRELQHRVQQEQLILTDLDPFASLQQSKHELNRLGELLPQGEIQGILKTMDSIEDGMKRAESMVTEMIQHREQAKEVVHIIEGELAQLSGIEASYEQQLARLQSSGNITAEQHQQSHYVLMIQYKHELESLLQEIKAALEPSTQQYKLAYERAGRAKTIMEQIHELRKQQKEALRSFEQLQRDYQTRLQQYGRRFNHRPYTSRYGGLQSTVEQLIMMGLFAEAMKQISMGRGILTQMDQEYRRMLDLERRRRMYRHGGPFGGGPFGGGMGGGRRPGGGGGFGGSSSWGGSSRSRGSSGWGGGGRSSGSSGFGGRSGGGGRSSGSSKW